MPSQLPTICKDRQNLKITVHPATTGHGRAMSIRYRIQEISAKVQGQGQIPAVQIAQGHIIPHPGQVIVFRNLSSRKPTQARGERAGVFQVPCDLHPLILHLQGLQEAIHPGHPEVVLVVAGRPVVHQEVGAGGAVNILHSILHYS